MAAPRQRYAVVTDQSWELARAAYVSGDSARVVCERFGMGEANLRKKAGNEGWTKRAWAAACDISPKDLAPPSPEPEPAAAPPATFIPPNALLQVILDSAMSRAGQAIIAGSGGEASALIRAVREWVTLNAEVLSARNAVWECDGMLDHVPASDHAMIREQAALALLQADWSKKR